MARERSDDFGANLPSADPNVRWTGTAVHADWLRYSLSNETTPVHLSNSGQGWVFHGCPLSIVHKILREGMVAGDGQHYKNGRTVKGHFFIIGDNFRECLQHARDRANVLRCTEWKQFKVPSGWSVPCVIVFRYPREELVRLNRVGWSCYKSANEGLPGDVLSLNTLLGRSLHVYFRLGELKAYRELHRISDGAQVDYDSCRLRLLPYMICGGRLNDPLAWASNDRNMSPSCGKCVPVDSLWNRSDWHRSGGGFWFCAECHSRMVRGPFDDLFL